MPNTVFAVLLGAVALYALFAATRAAARARIGWLLVVLAALVQAYNLLAGYSLVVAIATTVVLVGGYLMARSPTTVGPR